MTWILSRTAETQSGPVAWDRFGEGPALVLVHGTPTSSWLWRRVAAELARDFTVHLFDLAGYGQSAKFDGQDVSIGAQGRVLATLLDHWGLDRPFVAGHDIGGAAVMRAHLLHDRTFERIALLDAVSLRPREGGRWGTPLSRHVRDHDPGAFGGFPDYIQRGILAAYLATAVHRPLSAEALEALGAPWLGDAGRAAFYRQMSQLDERFTDEIEPLYGHTRAPVHVFWGEEDAWLDRDNALRLKAAIPGAGLTFIPGAGHFVQEDAPGAVMLGLRSFFLGG